MKYLEDEKLAQLTSELSDATLCGTTTSRRVINGRLEAYTMKRAGTDKKYAHALGEKYIQEMTLVENQMAKFQKLVSGGRLATTSTTTEKKGNGNEGRRRRGGSSGAGAENGQDSVSKTDGAGGDGEGGNINTTNNDKGSENPPRPKSSLSHGGATGETAAPTLAATADSGNSRRGRRRSQSVGSIADTAPSKTITTTTAAPAADNIPKPLSCIKTSSQRRVRSTSLDSSGRPTTTTTATTTRSHAGSGCYYSNSPLGDFHEMSTRRLMTDLILTLNASFPDYDFSNVKPSDFARLPSAVTAMNRINEYLSEFAATTSKGHGFLFRLWNAIDDVIVLNECEVYTFAPTNRDEDDDPLGFLWQTLVPLEDEEDGEDVTRTGGAITGSIRGRGIGGMSDDRSSSNTIVPLWSFNYFFVNKSLKRIVYFTCVQTMRNEPTLTLNDEDEDLWVTATQTTNTKTPAQDDIRIKSGDDAVSEYGYTTGGTGGELSGYYSVSSTAAESDMDFDLDPSSGDVAGGIAVSPPPPVATT